MNPLMQRLFHAVRDGLFIISRDGLVRFANEAALCLIPSRLGMPTPNPDLARIVAAIRDGHLDIPHRTEIELGAECLVAEADVIRAQVLASPVGSDLVVILHNLTERHFFETAVANLGQLIDRECREPLVEFDRQLGALLAIAEDPASQSAEDAQRIRQETLSLGHNLLDQFSRLAALAALSRGEALVTDERIVIIEWLSAIAERMRKPAEAKGMRLLLQKVEGELPAVYGSARWLERAFVECVDNAIKYGTPKSDILLSASQSGGFVRVMVRNLGPGGLPPFLQGRLMQTFHRGRNARDRGEPGLGLGLPLARQIVELHRGHLTLEKDLDGLVACTMELSTGAPAGDSRQLDLEQAQRYARDLARLMRRRSEPPPQQPPEK